MNKWRSLIIFAAIVGVVAAGGLVVSRLGEGTEVTPSPSEPVKTSTAEAPTVAEATPQTSKVVLDETQTSSGETFKAVSGKVVSVSGQTVVLEVEGDRLEVAVAADAKITQTTLPSQAAATPQVVEIGLDRIQVGQQVDALVKVENGQATATNLNVLVGP